MLEVGKEAVAIGSNDEWYTKGDIVQVNALCKGFCNCSPVLIDIGKTYGTTYTMLCEDCGFTSKSKDDTLWFCASQFAPIESQDISELTSILSEEPFKV